MAAVAHNPSFAKKVGIKQSVGKEFVAADKGKKFAGGGQMAAKKLFGGKETRAEEMKEAKALKSGKISKAQYVAGEKSEGHGKGAAKTAAAIKSGKISPKQYAQAETMMKKMASGGKAKGKGADVKIAMMKKEEPRRPDMGMTPPQRPMAAPPMAPRGMAPAGAPMMCGGGKAKKMAAGGLAAGHKSADGIATKGKTKGKEVVMARGGKAKRYC
jgi:hypothetical protein